MWAQEGLEEPSHTEGQEGWWEEIPLIQDKEQWLCGCGRAQRSYPTLKVKKGGGEEIPLSKVRSSSCALLEQLWRDTPHPR